MRLLGCSVLKCVSVLETPEGTEMPPSPPTLSTCRLCHHSLPHMRKCKWRVVKSQSEATNCWIQEWHSEPVLSGSQGQGLPTKTMVLYKGRKQKTFKVSQAWFSGLSHTSTDSVESRQTLSAWFSVRRQRPWHQAYFLHSFQKQKSQVNRAKILEI